MKTRLFAPFGILAKTILILILFASAQSTDAQAPKSNATPRAAPESASMLGSTEVFRDDFNGTDLDSNTWQAYQNGGTISIQSGFVTLNATNSPTFPYVHTKFNPIPQSGNFSIKVGIQYISVTGAGTGFIADDDLPANGTPDGTSLQIAFEIWQDTCCGGFRLNDYPNSIRYTLPAPDLNYHTVEFRWLDNSNEYYLDGQLVYSAARDDSFPRPTILWFGNPILLGRLDNWTSFKLDYIEIDNTSATTYSISGHVTDGSNNPISNVTISANTTISTTTYGNGNYTLGGLEAGTYTLTPSKTDFTFSPPTLQVTVPPDATGKNFAALQLIDLGFRPNPNGYNFANYFNSLESDLPTDVLRVMFNDTVVCKQVIGNICTERPQAKRFRLAAVGSLLGGHCDGMAVTSLRFFKGIDSVSAFQSGANYAHDIAFGTKIRQQIAHYAALQFLLKRDYWLARDQALAQLPSVTLEQVRAALSGSVSDPMGLMVLYVFRPGNRGGHSLTPYAVEDEGSGIYRILVYDNDYIDDQAAGYVEINTNAESWTFDGGSVAGKYSGDATTKSLGALPISKYDQYNRNSDCRWCPVPVSGNSASSSDTALMWLNGSAHLLITNSQGERIGFVGDQFVNEIPNALEFAPTGGQDSEPLYDLPLSDNYTTSLNGQTLANPENVSLTQFGPGYAIGIDDLTVNPSDSDQIKVSTDGKALEYVPSAAKAPTFVVSQDSTGDAYEFQLQAVDLAPNQSIKVSDDPSDGKLALNTASGGNSTYNLSITRIGSTGEQVFEHHDLAIAGTDTEYFNFGSWNGGAVTLQVDHGSDGTIDKTLSLNNQTSCTVAPVQPSVVKPQSGKTLKKKKVLLDWTDATCDTKFSLILRQDSKRGPKIAKPSNLSGSQYKTPLLTSGKTYFWRVTACNAIGCTKSDWWNFKVK